MRLPVALRLGRVSNLPTVWTNVLAAVALAGAAPAAPLAPLMLALSLFYIAGMYLNDAFDRELDARERPTRPIPAGEVSAPTVFALGYGMLAGGLGLLAAVAQAANGSGRQAALAGLTLAAAIVVYDRYHKGKPWSPVLMGLCRMLVYVAAGLAVAAVLPARLYGAASMLLCYVVGLTYAAKQEHLNRVSRLWPLAVLAVPFLGSPWLVEPGPVSVAIYAAFLAWVAYALSFLVIPARRRVPRAVTSLIAGISLFDALMIAGQGLAGLAWLAVAGFGLTLVLQVWVPGT